MRKVGTTHLSPIADRRPPIPASESGQAMIEFALILPLLLLLTFGTMELALHIQQQSTLNATAFMAARSASVLGNDKALAIAQVKTFTEAANTGWLAGSAEKLNAEGSNDEKSQFSIEMQADRLSGMMGALTEGKADWKNLEKMRAQAAMPLDYDARKLGAGTPVTLKKETLSLISYESKRTGTGNAVLAASAQKVIAELKTAVTPMAVLPGLGSSVPAILALDAKGEPFKTDGAVFANPRSQVAPPTSNQYLAPDFESRSYPGRVSAASIAQGAASYEASLLPPRAEESCRKIGDWTPPAQMTPEAQLIQTAVAAVKTAIAAPAGDVAVAAEAAYRKLKSDEKKLF